MYGNVASTAGESNLKERYDSVTGSDPLVSVAPLKKTEQVTNKVCFSANVGDRDGSVPLSVSETFSANVC